MTYYIAVDIGASSGRLMLGSVTKEKKITLKEVHRFKNGFSKVGKYDCWDIKHLIREILLGLEKVKQQGIKSCTVGIDTWAVDYCLVDAAGNLISQPVAYRDERTNGAVEKFEQYMPLNVLYQKTGIQIQPFNTLFQLLVEETGKLVKADKLLLIPDFLGYVFTGSAVTEKSNASTTQLLNADKQEWDEELLNVLGIDEKLFPELVDAGTVLGKLHRDKFGDYDLPDATFITVASHDTASAILGTPGMGNHWAYISSGTWSLLGVETTKPIRTKDAYETNYTNEWGADHTVRFLKNIMGMWLIQEVSRLDGNRYSYAEISKKVAELPSFQQFIDVNDTTFLNPKNMTVAIQTYCKKTNQPVPENIWQVARCIYDNLALCYAVELEMLEQLSGRTEAIEQLHIVGGGAHNHLLNQLTANLTQKKVVAGPTEATAIGNLVMQMMVEGEFTGVNEAREAIRNSFDVQEFLPQEANRRILEAYKTFLKGRVE